MTDSTHKPPGITEAGDDSMFSPKPVRWWRSMRVHAIAMVVAMVAMATGVCGYLAIQAIEKTLTESTLRDAALLAETTSRRIASEWGEGNAQDVQQVIDRMVLDLRVAFMLVADDQGQFIAQRICDRNDWSHVTPYLADDTLGSDPQNQARTITSSKGEKALALRRQPIWSAQQNAVSGSQRTQRVLGYLTIGLEDPYRNAVVADVRQQTMWLSGVVCLTAALLVVIWIRNWTQPLKKLTHAVAHFRSDSPAAVPQINSSDEIGLLADVFGRMQQNLSAAHQQLTQTNAQLEDSVEQRTQQFRRVNDRLTNEMKEKDEFLRAISHDLNAPLRNIAGMTKMLMMKYSKELAEDATAKLQRITANVDAEAELLNDLLELSRIRTRQGKRLKVDTVELVQQIRDTLSYELESKRINLVMEQSLPCIVGDRNRLRQVFQNLIDNAVKYMPDEHSLREIHVGCREEIHQWLFHIRDTGRGIAEEDRERIFQVFQRARYSGSTQINGRGVGLSAVKNIVETHGGRVWVDSIPGDGSTFYFTIEKMAEQDETQPAGDDAEKTSLTADTD